MRAFKHSLSLVSAVSVASLSTAFAEDLSGFEDELFGSGDLLELSEAAMSNDELSNARGGFKVGGLEFNIGVVVTPPVISSPFGDGGVFGDSGGPLPDDFDPLAGTALDPANGGFNPLAGTPLDPGADESAPPPAVSTLNLPATPAPQVDQPAPPVQQAQAAPVTPPPPAPVEAAAAPPAATTPAPVEAVAAPSATTTTAPVEVTVAPPEPVQTAAAPTTTSADVTPPPAPATPVATSTPPATNSTPPAPAPAAAAPAPVQTANVESSPPTTPPPSDAPPARVVANQETPPPVNDPADQPVVVASTETPDLPSPTDRGTETSMAMSLKDMGSTEIIQSIGGQGITTIINNTRSGITINNEVDVNVQVFNFTSYTSLIRGSNLSSRAATQNVFLGGLSF